MKISIRVPIARLGSIVIDSNGTEICRCPSPELAQLVGKLLQEALDARVISEDYSA